MADYPIQIVAEILKRQSSLAQNFPDVIGTDVMRTDQKTYNVNLMLVLLFGVTWKILQDLNPGVVTDAALLARLDTALEGEWPEWILTQDPRFGVPEPQ